MTGRGRIVTVVLLACVTLTSAISFWLYASSGLTNQAKPFACLAQAFVILIAIAHSLRLAPPGGFSTLKRANEKDIRNAGYESLRDLHSDSEKIRKALKQYANYWRWLLVSWLSLYVFLAILGFKGLDLSTLIANADVEIQLLGIRLSLFNTLLNNWNTGMLFLCFYVLNKQMKDESGKRNLVNTPFYWLRLFSPASSYLSSSSCLWQILVSLLFRRGPAWPAVSRARLPWRSLVGRLQSKFLGPRLWLLIALYSYTAIQPLFSVP